MKDEPTYIPVIESFIYYRLKKSYPTCNIHITNVKEVIWRVVKNNGGVPRYYTNAIIEDMIKLKLIKRVNNNGLFLILSSNCDTRIKQIESVI